MRSRILFFLQKLKASSKPLKKKEIEAATKFHDVVVTETVEILRKTQICIVKGLRGFHTDLERGERGCICRISLTCHKQDDR